MELLLYFKLRLLENTIESAGSKFITRLSGYGNPAGLYRMFVLAVAPTGGNQIPAVSFDLLDYISDFWWHEFVFHAAS